MRQANDWAMIATDLDGTLLDSRKRVSASNIEALVACRQRGMRIVFATARPARSVRRLLPEELLRIGTVIAYNGAYVCDERNRTIARTLIPKPLSEEIIAYCAEHGGLPGLLVESDDTAYAAAPPNLADWGALTPPNAAEAEELMRLPASKLLLHRFGREDELRERFGSQVEIVSTDGGDLLHIMPLGVSKASALRAVCELMGIELRQAVVFGDDGNDLELFRTEAYKVAMGNALPALKSLADTVTASNDEDGVALALERLTAGDGIHASAN